MQQFLFMLNNVAYISKNQPLSGLVPLYKSFGSENIPMFYRFYEETCYTISLPQFNFHSI